MTFAASATPLDDLVGEVVERNPELNFYSAEIEIAKSGRRSAAALSNPEVTTQVGRKTVRDAGLSDEGTAWSVSIQQPFEWRGRIPLRKAIANQQIKLAELGFAQFKATLAAKARSLAYTLVAAEQKSAAASEVAGRFLALREVLVQRDPAGLTPALELRIIESTHLILQSKATEAALRQQSILLQLNQLRGKPANSPIQLVSGDFAFAPPPESPALHDAASTNNFELQMRKAELEQQGFKVSLAHNERYPAVSAGPFFSQERARDTENIVGLSVSIPIPLWKGNKENIATAKARELQAQTSFLVAQRDVERKVAEQLLRYQTKVNEMAKWRADSVAQFREAASLADRHYRLGAVPIATYVELQKQYLEAVETLLETKIEALEAAQELQLLTGLDFNAVKFTPANESAK